MLDKASEGSFKQMWRMFERALLRCFDAYAKAANVQVSIAYINCVLTADRTR